MHKDTIIVEKVKNVPKDLFTILLLFIVLIAIIAVIGFSYYYLFIMQKNFTPVLSEEPSGFYPKK